MNIIDKGINKNISVYVDSLNYDTNFEEQGTYVFDFILIKMNILRIILLTFTNLEFLYNLLKSK